MDFDKPEELIKLKNSIAQIITQVLATLPKHQGTEEKICNLVADKFPNVGSVNWRGSIITCLTRRKKFFNVVGYTDDSTPIWTFNSSFKNVMLLKWAPNYKEENNYEKSPVKSIPCPVIVSSDPLSIPSTYRNHQNVMSIEQDSPINLDPEFMYTYQLIDPPIQENDKCEISEKNKLFEKSPLELRAPNEEHSMKNITHPKDLISDFSKITIDKDEAFYRMKFYKEMKNRDTSRAVILQCRLHCSVCDCHLGSAGPVVSQHVRIHSSLRVLVCDSCFALTDADPQTFVAVCQWCFKVDGVHFLCSTCPAKCCEDCVKRNFGNSWSNLIAQKKTWSCFLCDMKQLWPHRAVAYLLLLYYLQLKNENKVETSVDMTTCCSPASEQNESRPALTLPDLFSPNPRSSLAQLAEFVMEHQTQHTREQTFVKPNQTLNSMYTISPQRIPSLMLNTKSQNTSKFDSGHLPHVDCVAPVKSVKTTVMARPIQSGTPAPLIQDSLVSQSVNGISSTTPQATFISTVTVQQNLAENPALHLNFNVQKLKSHAVSTERDSPMRLPQSLVNENESQGSMLRDSSSKEISSELSDQNFFLGNQIINRRPMPKSKRDMLLKNLIISSGIDTSDEILSDQIDIDDICTSSHDNLLEGFIKDFSQDLTPQPSHVQTGYEPILQSIIDSTTNCLNSLNNRRGEFNANGMNGKIATEREASNIEMGTIQDFQSGEELPTVGANDDNGAGNDEILAQFHDDVKEVDVRGLKQGIIDASRILVNTQKRFKEIARIISNSSTFKKAYALKLLKQFMDILSKCQKDMNAIDSSIKVEFSGLRRSTNMDKILNSIKKAENEKAEVERAALKKSGNEKLERKRKITQFVTKSQLKKKHTQNEEPVMITDVRSLLDSEGGTGLAVKNLFRPQNDTFLDETEKSLQIETKNSQQLAQQNENSLETLESIECGSMEEPSKINLITPQIKLKYKDQNERKKDLEMYLLSLNQQLKKNCIGNNRGKIHNQRKFCEIIAPCELKRKRGRPPGSKNKSTSSSLNPSKKGLIDNYLDADGSVNMGIHSDRFNDDNSSLTSSKGSPERDKLFRRSKMSHSPQRLTHTSSLALSTFLDTVNITNDAVIPFPMNYIIKPCSVSLERLTLGTEESNYYW